MQAGYFVAAVDLCAWWKVSRKLSDFLIVEFGSGTYNINVGFASAAGVVFTILVSE